MKEIHQGVIYAKTILRDTGYGSRIRIVPSLYIQRRLITLRRSIHRDLISTISSTVLVRSGILRVSTWSFVVIVIIVVVADVSAQGRRPADSSALTPAISSQGLPGLIAVPTATVLPTGTADLNFNTTHNTALFGDRGDFTQWNINFALGLFSRFVVGGRGAEVNLADGSQLLKRDLSANVQLLLLRENRYLPAVAVGWQDVSGGAVHFQARYAVASKTLGRRVRVTAGLGLGPHMLDGLFGGIELVPSSYAHLLAEHDGNRFAGGVRLLPVPPRLVRAGWPQLAGDLMWNKEAGTSWGITLRTPLDPVRKLAGRAARPGVPASRPAVGSNLELVDVVQSELLALGFENVRVSWLDPVLTLEYENRRFNRNELDALARAYESLSHVLPDSVETVTVILKEVGLAVLQISVPADDLPELARRTLQPEALRERTRFEQPARVHRGKAATITGVGDPSRLKLDVVVAPGIETVVFTEVGVAKARLHAMPEFSAQLFPGGAIAVGALIPLMESEAFPALPAEPHINGALGHLAFRLPRLGNDLSGLTQFSGGLFTRDFFGWINETEFLTWGRRISLGWKIGVIRSRVTHFDRLLAVARGRYYIPEVDTRLTVYAGRFFDLDHGVTLDLARFFGDTEIGLFLRTTTSGSLAGIRISLPLSPIKDMRPYRVRLRPPAKWGYEQRTTVFTDTNLLRYDIGRVVLTGHEIEDAFHNRDRMSAGYFIDYFSRNQ